MEKLLILIEGETEIQEITDIKDYGYLPIIELEDGTEWYIAENHREAGEKAREYWEDLANDDPQEFACIVGEETLIKWGLGQYAGPGQAQVKSLNEWLDLHKDCPEETFANYDGYEKTAKINNHLMEELGFNSKDEIVVYRHN